VWRSRPPGGGSLWGPGLGPLYALDKLVRACASSPKISWGGHQILPSARQFYEHTKPHTNTQTRERACLCLRRPAVTRLLACCTSQYAPRGGSALGSAQVQVQCIKLGPPNRAWACWRETWHLTRILRWRCAIFGFFAPGPTKRDSVAMQCVNCRMLVSREIEHHRRSQSNCRAFVHAVHMLA
jgi:hypothetical protein